MAISAELGDNLQHFTGNSDVSMSEKFSSGAKTPKQQKHQTIHSSSTLRRPAWNVITPGLLKAKLKNGLTLLSVLFKKIHQNQ